MCSHSQGRALFQRQRTGSTNTSTPHRTSPGSSFRCHHVTQIVVFARESQEPVNRISKLDLIRGFLAVPTLLAALRPMFAGCGRADATPPRRRM